MRTTCKLWTVGFALLIGGTSAVSAGEPPVPVPDAELDKKVRLLLAGEFWAREVTQLRAFGEKAFPTYLDILNDPETEFFEFARTCVVIMRVKADRSQFVSPALKGVAHIDPYTRRISLQLLGHIGSERDAAPVALLLADEKEDLVRVAAETLSKIGGDRGLVAFDVWLNSNGVHRDNKDVVKHIKTCRAELEKRLKEKAASQKP